MKVNVVEKNGREKTGYVSCEIERNLNFEISDLGTYFLAGFDSVVYDAMLVAASVEFCDRLLHRPSQEWSRIFEVSIPVHEPDRWSEHRVSDSLHDLLKFLTGDDWLISFVHRKVPQPSPPQLQLAIEADIEAVLPFSNGLDSQCVAWLLEKQMGRKLVRVRLNPKDDSYSRQDLKRLPFACVPYSIKEGGQRFSESTARSRGFKFALLGGVAAYLSKARRVINPESGQGALGPTLVPVGQGYEDYRCHPLFTNRVEIFLEALLGYKVQFEFPRLWYTKGETITQYLKERTPEVASLIKTKSCWQQNRQVSVAGKARQCGICAACLLRRLSLHAAKVSEPADAYVWERLTSNTFQAAVASDFDRSKITSKMKEYAIAGVLHLNHLAALSDSTLDIPMLNLRADQLESMNRSGMADARSKLKRLLAHHSNEWNSFLSDLGRNSFVLKWAGRELE